MQRWDIGAEEQAFLREQLPDGLPTRHDLSVLDGARDTRVPGSSHHTALVGAAGGVGSSDADEDELAVRLVDHRPVTDGDVSPGAGAASSGCSPRSSAGDLAPLDLGNGPVVVNGVDHNRKILHLHRSRCTNSNGRHLS